MKAVGVLASILVSAILIGLGTVVFGVEVSPVYGSPIWTIILSAVVASTVGILELLPVIIVGLMGIVSFKVGEQGIKGATTLGCFAAVVLVAYLLGVVFLHPWLITSVVVDHISWFPEFTYWQYFTITLLGLLFTGSTNNKTNDKKN